MSNEQRIDDEAPKYCSNCGNPLRSNISFCPACGKQISTTSSGIGSHEVAEQSPVVQQPQNYSSSKSSGPISHPVADSVLPKENKQKGIVSSNIPPVSGQFFTKSELKLASLFGLTGFVSHLVRYIILFNKFPNLITLLFPIPFYIILGIIILGLHKFFMRNKGVDIQFDADNYDYMVSIVFSSFFLSLMNYRANLNFKASTIPEIVYHPQNTKQGLQYLELPKTQYVGQFVRPFALFNFMISILIISLFTLWYYFQEPFSDIGLIARFISMYLGGMGVSHMSPRVGRINEEMSIVGRFRTLFVYIITVFVFAVSLIGSNFFIVLN